MDISTRKVLDKVLTYVSYGSLAVMVFAILFFLTPIIINGIGAVFFKATIEHNKFLCENLDYTQSQSYLTHLKETNEARKPLYEMMNFYENSSELEVIEKNIKEKRNEALLKITKENSLAIMAKSNYVEEVKKLSGEIFSDYVSYIKSLKNSNSIMMSKVLEDEREELSEAVKDRVYEVVSKKEMKFSKRSSLRRNLTSFPIEFVEGQLDILSEKNLAYNNFKHGVEELLGPKNNKEKEAQNLIRYRYGQPRMDNAEKVFESSVMNIMIRAKNEDGILVAQRVSSMEFFKDTKVEEMIKYIGNNFDAMLYPHYTFYWGFFTDDPYDSNIFGGIYPMILGTFYLTLFSMLIAAPLGIFAAIYFAEYARKSKIASILEMCVGTLAGVPSIVFGLFGLAFLINTLKVSESKSVIAGSITLALLILPTIIRSSIVALQSVPHSYREASLGLGASKWKSIMTVILPAALPSILTGIIISMGRAAGETAPIIFTAATSTGAALAITEVFSQPTPALPWNIYNICAEHELADRVVHVQYGMVLTLIGIVLILNFAAIYLRARLQKRMK